METKKQKAKRFAKKAGKVSLVILAIPVVIVVGVVVIAGSIETEPSETGVGRNWGSVPKAQHVWGGGYCPVCECDTCYFDPANRWNR